MAQIVKKVTTTTYQVVNSSKNGNRKGNNGSNSRSKINSRGRMKVNNSNFFVSNPDNFTEDQVEDIFRFASNEGLEVGYTRAQNNDLSLGISGGDKRTYLELLDFIGAKGQGTLETVGGFPRMYFWGLELTDNAFDSLSKTYGLD